MSSYLENVLKEFVTSQKAFNKIVEGKLEKLDSLVSKVEELAHDVEIFGSLLFSVTSGTLCQKFKL